MQTFLPYQDYERCARVLDHLRLGKQRVEAKQILLALLQGDEVAKPVVSGSGPIVWGKIPDPLPRDLRLAATPWLNHPAVKMWRGYECSLARYGMAMCAEWLRRGFEENLFDFFSDKADKLWPGQGEPNKPAWLNEAFCSNHRARLLDKNPEFYGKFGWTEEPTKTYFWPVSINVFWED